MANLRFEDIPPDRVKDAFLNECVFASANGYALYGGWKPDRYGKNGEEIRLKRKGEKPGQRGAVAHIFYDTPQHGYIVDWHEGNKITASWKITESALRFAGGGTVPAVRLTPQQEKERDEARARELAQKQAEAAANAERIFQTARAAALRDYEGMLEIAPCGATGPGAEYLKSKRVAVLPGVRLTWQKFGEAFPPRSLVVPYFDVLTGDFVTFQRIIPGGIKGYNSGFGGRAPVYWIGTEAPNRAPKRAAVFALAEGYATGATFAQLSGLPVGVAGDAYKLKALAAKILSCWGSARLIIASDDDFMKTQQFFDAFQKATGKSLNDARKERNPAAEEKKPTKNTGAEIAAEIFALAENRVYIAFPKWDWTGRDLQAAIRSPEAARSDWNDFALYYPTEAPAAVKEVLDGAQKHFQRNQ